MDSLQGYFLVASPHLPDTNFFRTVVLMLHHDDEGSFGVVLNRPSSQTVQDVWEALGEDACESKQAIHVGGPVPGPLMVLHREAQWSESEVLPGIYLATERDYLREIILQSQSPFRVFSGYAGWAAGQLENELEVGGWLTTPASAEWVFAEADELWKQVARKIGLDILSPSLKTRHLPEDPSVN